MHRSWKLRICHHRHFSGGFHHGLPPLRLPQEVDLEDYVSRPEKISCADIAAICQEAGMRLGRGWFLDLGHQGPHGFFRVKSIGNHRKTIGTMETSWENHGKTGGFHRHGGTPIAGWFIGEHRNLKWMMNRGTPTT